MCSIIRWHIINVMSHFHFLETYLALLSKPLSGKMSLMLSSKYINGFNSKYVKGQSGSTSGIPFRACVFVDINACCAS